MVGSLRKEMVDLQIAFLANASSLRFVPNLAFDLLDDIWGYGFHAVRFSSVLCRFLHQFVLSFSARLEVAAGHDISAANHLSHDDSSLGLFRILFGTHHLDAKERLIPFDPRIVGGLVYD
jgi:hypothetical protein